MGVGRGPGPLRNAGIGSPASSHHCTTPKWLPNSDRPFGDRPMTITMVQIQLRDCDYAIAMPGMAHRAVPGIDRNGCCHRRATGPPATFERRPPMRRSSFCGALEVSFTPDSGHRQHRSIGPAMGQSRRFDPLPVTSGLPRTTDISRPAPLVRFVPFANELADFRTSLRAKIGLMH